MGGAAATVTCTGCGRRFASLEVHNRVFTVGAAL